MPRNASSFNHIVVPALLIHNVIQHLLTCPVHSCLVVREIVGEEFFAGQSSGDSIMYALDNGMFAFVLMNGGVVARVHHAVQEVYTIGS